MMHDATHTICEKPDFRVVRPIREIRGELIRHNRTPHRERAREQSEDAAPGEFAGLK